MKYIIIDDEEMNLFITKRLLLQALGEADISTFSSAGEALRYFKNDFNCQAHDHVIVLLDLNMPVVSGWDFLEFFAQFEDELKSIVHIYIVTSSLDPREKSKALSNANVISFVSKPITVGVINEYFKDCYLG